MPASTSGSVALLLPRARRGLEQAVTYRRRGHIAQAVIVIDFQAVAATGELVLDRLAEPSLDREVAGIVFPGEEGIDEVIGVEARRVDRCLQIEAEMNMAQEGLQRPLVLAVA